ncbi:hypothetical protein HY450_01695 [Candidatus Pacearchaeota archaeon]|nr:hypothetical protein [Candidatus Pacearchaeota archaeon]
MTITNRDYHVSGERSKLFRERYENEFRIVDKIEGKDGGLVLNYSNPPLVVALFKEGTPAVQIVGDSGRIEEAVLALERVTGVILEEVFEKE